MQTKHPKHPLLINIHKHVFMKKTDLGYEIEKEEIGVSPAFKKPKPTYFKDWEFKHFVAFFIMITLIYLLINISKVYNLPY